MMLQEKATTSIYRQLPSEDTGPNIHSLKRYLPVNVEGRTKRFMGKILQRTLKKDIILHNQHIWILSIYEPTD